MKLGVDVKIVGLTANDARKAMALRSSFSDALTIARAYDLHRLSEWIS